MEKAEQQLMPPLKENIINYILKFISEREREVIISDLFEAIMSQFGSELKTKCSNNNPFADEMFAESATRHHVEMIQSIFAEIFRKMMDNGLMIKGDADIIALEFAAPVTLMIQMSDRQPEKKAQAIETINRHFDMFIERYCIEKK